MTYVAPELPCLYLHAGEGDEGGWILRQGIDQTKLFIIARRKQLFDRTTCLPQDRGG